MESFNEEQTVLYLLSCDSSQGGKNGESEV